MVLPTAGSCGTPSRHQLLSLRSLLLSATSVKIAEGALQHENIAEVMNSAASSDDSSAVVATATTAMSSVSTSVVDLKNASNVTSQINHSEWLTKRGGSGLRHTRHDAHRGSLTVLLVVRTKSRSMENVAELVESLQLASIGSQWTEAGTTSTDGVDLTKATAPSPETIVNLNEALQTSYSRHMAAVQLRGAAQTEARRTAMELEAEATQGADTSQRTTVNAAHLQLEDTVNVTRAPHLNLTDRERRSRRLKAMAQNMPPPRIEKVHRTSVSSIPILQAPKNNVMAGISNMKRGHGKLGSNSRDVPRESIGAHPPFHLRFFNDSSLPKTQVIDNIICGSFKH